MSKPQYTLYTIVANSANKDAQNSHSMHVNKTKSDLAILGIPYNEVKMTFADIRSELERITGNKTVTVPTLKVGENEYVTDSFKIAEWLDAHHGTPDKTLFGSEAAHAFARWLQVWTDGDMALGIRELFRPLFYKIQDEASADYFLRVRYGNEKELLETQIARFDDPEAVKKLGVRARDTLKLVENYLKARDTKFLLGDKPTHPDSILYGWYACSLVNRKFTLPELWEHPDLPRVAAWAKDMKRVTGLEPSFPDPLKK